MASSMHVPQGEPKSFDEANRILEEIQGRKGHLSDSTREWLASAPERHKHEIIEKFEAFRKEAIKFVKSTTTLNSSDAHFLHELLQNADDALYNKVKEQGMQPWIRFRLMEDTIEVETNENGFSRADVEAICETGESSKKLSSKSQHIGEKGIGFKSIFRIAQRVHIASGFWRFHFHRDEKDDGLGMVTPLLDGYEPLPAEVGTRLTLKLNDRYKLQFSRLVQEFQKVPDTVLFFLRNIKTLKITIEHSANNCTVTLIEKINYLFSSRCEVKKTTHRTQGQRSQEKSVTSRLYEVFHGKTLVMPQDRRRHYRSAAIILAFPLDTTGTTALLDREGQHVFAYLPMYRLIQLPFLIQSDFITAANRENTEDCDWNDTLRRATASTFCDAIESFCQRNFLVFEWLQFIPELPIDGFWAPLQSLIVDGIKGRAVFCTYTSRSLLVHHKLRQIPHAFTHEGKPLLADLVGPKESYLATEYNKHRTKLQLLKLGALEFAETLDRLDNDLSQSNSRLRSSSTSVEWHEIMASWILKLYDSGSNSQLVQRLMNMDIIPLVSGFWTSFARQKLIGNDPNIYLPTINNVSVPEDIGYALVDGRALLSSKRTILFRRMGAKTLEVDHVVRRITKRHLTPLSSSVTSYVNHLYFLYRFNVGVLTASRKLRLVSSARKACSMPIELYIQSSNAYSADWLLRRLPLAQMNTKRARGHWILHNDYFDERLTSPDDNVTTWRQWLIQEVGLNEFPPLIGKSALSTPTLSSFLQELLSSSSQLFLNTLQARWIAEYSATNSELSADSSLLQACRVKCQDGQDHPLRDTYLPSIEVVQRAEELGIRNRCAILDIDLQGKVHEWHFLKDIGVHIEVDIEFHLQALSFMVTSRPALLAYDWIGSNAAKAQASYLKERFMNRKLSCFILPSGQTTWHHSNECVWEGPPFLTVKKPLATHYRRNENATHLFKNLLELPNVTWKDLVEQLKVIKSGTAPVAVTEVSDIYLELFVMAEVSWDEVRESFASDELVYASGKWYSVNVCLWSSSVDIEGCPILVRLYPKLESFFTEKLRVKKAKVGQVVSEMIRQTRRSPPLGHVEAKTFLKQISAMLEFEERDESTQKKLDELTTCKFLPVKKAHGPTRLVDCSSDFAIRDHHGYSQVFADVATFIDFSFEEVPQISLLIDALSLEANYLTQLVEERSRVGDNASFHQGVTDDLRHKAPCLFSCAYKHRSPRVRVSDNSLFEELRRLEVYTSSTISTELVLVQDGVELRKDNAEAHVLFEYNDGVLQLYIPSNEQQRRSCFRSKLPAAFFDLMEIEYDAALMPLSLVLTNNLCDMADIMDESSLPCVPWLDKDLYDFLRSDKNSRAAALLGTPQPNGPLGQQQSIPLPPAGLEPNDGGNFNNLDDDSDHDDDIGDTSSDEDRMLVRVNAQQLNTPTRRNVTSRPGTSPVVFGLNQQFRFGLDSSLPSNGRANGSPASVPGQRSSPVFANNQQSANSIFTSTSLPSGSLCSSQQAARYRSLLDQVIICAARKHDQSTIEGSASNVEVANMTESTVVRAQEAGDNNSRSVTEAAIPTPNAPQPLDGTSSLTNKKRLTAWDFIDLNLALPSISDIELLFGPRGFERDCKIGAAGELYVFERLKHLKLPGFGIDNWQSRMRKYVTIHHNYGQMTGWDGSETADIVYNDSTGRLQEWLRNVSCNGFPDLAPHSPHGGDSGCKYYIEVKSTTLSTCDTRFYMSKNEYDLMYRCKVVPDQPPDVIYVIFRVFELTTKEIAFKVFVDPTRSRTEFTQPNDRPSLRFEAEKWHVYPLT